jgi:hypothetical protein
VTSAELARVVEITPIRMFESRNDGEDTPARVMYNAQKDRLYCNRCGEHDSCGHTARVRLSGLLTHSVTSDVKKRTKGLAVIQGGAA